MSAFEDVAAHDEIAEGTLRDVTLADGTPVCLFRYEGTIGAVSNICTHAKFLISDGMLHANGTLECAWHGARFDCRTGAVRRQPACDALPVFRVRIEDSRVLVGPVVNTATEKAS